MEQVDSITSSGHTVGLRAAESLRWNFFWVFTGNTLYALCNWGILVVLAKLGSTALVGKFALGLAITAPVFIFTNLNLRAVQATDARNSYCHKDYVQLRYVTIGIALLASLLLTVLFDYDWTITAVILAVACMKGIDSASDVSYGLYQKHEVMFYIAKFLLLKGPLSLLVFALSFTWFHDVIISILCAVFVRLLIYAIYERPLGFVIERAALRTENGRAQSRVRAGTLLQLAMVSLPLGIVALVNSLCLNIPRFFIEKYSGIEQLGVFAGVAYLMVAGVTVVTALGHSATPRLARYFASKDMRSYKRLLVVLLGIGLLLGIAGLLISLSFGEALLQFLYTTEYAGYSQLLVLVMLAAMLSYLSSFLGFGMTAARKFKIQTPISLVSLITILAASLFLIPMAGLEGACYCLIVLYLVQIPIKLLVIRHAIKNDVERADYAESLP